MVFFWQKNQGVEKGVVSMYYNISNFEFLIGLFILGVGLVAAALRAAGELVATAGHFTRPALVV